MLWQEFLKPAQMWAELHLLYVNFYIYMDRHGQKWISSHFTVHKSGLSPQGLLNASWLRTCCVLRGFSCNAIWTLYNEVIQDRQRFWNYPSIIHQYCTIKSVYHSSMIKASVFSDVWCWSKFPQHLCQICSPCVTIHKTFRGKWLTALWSSG